MTRTDTPAASDERTTTETLLQYVRDTALRKVEGLPDDLAHAAPVPTSPMMTAAAVLNHLRWVENWWVEIITCDREDLAPMTEEDPDGEFTISFDMPLAQVVADYRAQIELCDELLAGLDLDAPTARPVRDFHPNVRWVLLHLIEETARHNGHLDLLRELADGAKGD